MKAALLVTWSESERGWGQRPDGASLHLSQQDVKAYVRAYWEEEKRNNPDGGVPHEYSRPDVERGRLVLVDDALHQRLAENQHGLRLWQRDYSDLRNKGRLLVDLETRETADVRSEREEEVSYVGLVESNDWEGEVFGYYWEHTADAERHLRGLLDRYVAEGDVSMRIEVVSETRLHELDDADRNGYRRRVSVYEAPEDWDAFVETIAPADRNITDDEVHPFYKGRGLPEKMRRREWR